MRGKTKVLSAVTALALTAASAAAATAAPPAGTTPQKAADEVTLVTGDKVLLGQDGQVVAIQPGEGRKNMIFKTARRADGHTMVVPKDAFEPLAAGRLDSRLFDVTTLLEFGYRDRMPLIVDGRARVGARSSGDWAALRTEAATGDKIWLDGIRKPSLDRSVAQIGAPAAHQKGITGKGIKVAIVDTGVDEKHPDLAGQQIAEKNFTTDPDNTDNVGHGTHVGSTVASHDSKYGGVAPGAQLIDAKVCVEFGCQESWILDGMRWAAEQGAQVVNMSLGGGDTPEVDPLEQAVNDLTAQYGTLFVIAAGNSGSTGSVSSPSTAEAALSVGAVDRDDKLAPFSSKGPRVGDSGLKPEVTAPGVDIVAAKAGTSDHLAGSGTSMATPHVAGAAALLRQQHPEWTPAQLKSVLATTAKPTEGVSAFDQGAGRIDVAKAIGQVLTADVVAVNLGLHEWPHADDKPVTKPITYSNPTDAAITLDLAFKGSAPAGMFTLGASKLTVPAKGTASVTVTGDSRVGTKDAAYSGEIVATSGPHTVRTLVGIDREVESYTLSIDMIGRDGGDPADSFTFIAGLDNDTFKAVFGAGDQKIRLPKGTYFLDTTLGNGPQGMDMLYQPTVKLTSDQTIKQDARLAQPVSVKAPEPVGDFAIGLIAVKRSVGGEPRLRSTSVMFGGFDGVAIAQGGAQLPPDELSSLAMLQTNAAADPHTFYRLAYPFAGGLPVGLTKAPAKKELARVESTIGGQKPDSQASKGELPLSPQGLSGGTALYPVAVGATAVDYVTPEGLRWQSAIMTRHANGAQERITSGLRKYQAGKTYREREVRPVFSPGLPESEYGFVERYGTQLYVSVPLVSDANHGDGRSTVDSARTALYRNGVLIGETTTPGGSFSNVPLPQADFRAEMSLDRSSQFEFSTRVSAVWTFKSKGTEGKIDAPPLSVVRFEPKLDDNGAVPAGTLQRIGLLTQTQGDAGKVRITGVEYSHDDGKSWRRAGVVGNSALVYNPANAQWTSLKATATDAKGGTVELTVIRAYKVGA
ncbi:Serine protease, subtilisin family [Lentzea waywayandensis]|uniref:Serine protease, subtilisin family n=1 Tax=Lentzea waywayandensis TaxID=84724 RepID=A0A1I6FFX9_9PSEU|nr:S8 family serine peptidase [Lentzea waywayandensis]SFR28856.1 Serine protease, subtilisin family [Lentzea waywayandensis]